MGKERVPVSARALIQRINRKLASQNERLLASREGSRSFQDLGRFYVVDTRVNGVVEKDVDLETRARKLDALAAWERLADD